MSSCRACGDASCSIECDNPAGRPAINITRGGTPFVVKGCPFKQIPPEVSQFYADMEKQEAGYMAPYPHDQIPAKYQDMIDLYKSWRPFFETRKRQRDEPPEGLSEIEAFRRAEVKR